MNIGNNNAIQGYSRQSYAAGQGIERAAQIAGKVANQMTEPGQWNDTYTPSSFLAQTRNPSYGLFSSDYGTQGYAVDVNGNGRYDRGVDGVLVLDYNGDGKFDDAEVNATGFMMRSMTGNYDFNNDGKVSAEEARAGQHHRAHFAQLDLNRDGRLSNEELSRGNFGVWQDTNGDGQVSTYEKFSVSSISVPKGVGRVDGVDPYHGRGQVSTRGWNETEQEIMSRLSKMVW